MLRASGGRKRRWTGRRIVSIRRARQVRAEEVLLAKSPCPGNAKVREAEAIDNAEAVSHVDGSREIGGGIHPARLRWSSLLIGTSAGPGDEAVEILQVVGTVAVG